MALAVTGSGHIGLEFGMLGATVGLQISVLDTTPGLLPGQECDGMKFIERSAREMGGIVHRETYVKSFKYHVDGLLARGETPS